MRIGGQNWAGNRESSDRARDAIAGDRRNACRSASPYEKCMLYLTRLAPVNRLPKDKVLSPAFSRLFGDWMRRSQLANRQEVLYFAMEWDLEQAYELALNSLGQTTDTEILAHAMQAIAKHGKETDAAFLLPFLDDNATCQRASLCSQPSRSDGAA